MLDSVLVVGGGLSGLQTVAALRDQGFTGRVTVVGAEPLLPYDRPPLSKQLLSRPEPVLLAEDLGVDLTTLADEVRLASTAAALHVDDGGVRVRLAAENGHDDADVVAADAVVLATGGRPVLPPAWREAGALALHTAADAAVLRERLTPGTRLVVVGAGWIGAEVAGVAAGAGVDVTVVEAAAQPLASALGPAHAHLGRLAVPWYAAAGVRLMTGTPVTRVLPGEVVLADGTALPADVVLVAVGVRPATAWLGDTLPLLPDGSVLVDLGGRPVSPAGPPVPDAVRRRVRAVGDVATRESPRFGRLPGGHWDTALRAPAPAVASLLADHDGSSVGGGAVVPEPAPDLPPYVFSTQLGHDLAMLGRPGDTDDVVVRGPADPHPEGEGTGFRDDPVASLAAGGTLLWFRPGTEELTAVLTVDRPRDVAAARRLLGRPGPARVDRTAVTDEAVRLA